MLFNLEINYLNMRLIFKLIAANWFFAGRKIHNGYKKVIIFEAGAVIIDKNCLGRSGIDSLGAGAESRIWLAATR